MKQIDIPLCREQQIFEDDIKTLLEVFASLTEQRRDAVLDYALSQQYTQMKG